MLKCIAIDDEPIALSILSNYCERRGNISLETFTSPCLGMARVRECPPDILFLDIEMKGVSGLELAREIPLTCSLIFTTAFARYALDGFDVNAVDFLHKPFFYDRFLRAIEKAEQWLQMQDLLRLSRARERQIVLKSDYKNVAVPFDKILYVESLDNYVKLHMVDGSTLMSKIALSRVEEMLPSPDFIRIHRSYIIPRKRIESFTATQVTLQGKTLPIGKKYAPTLLSSL
ncbi:MAG: LytR/AlgR family response regulator transcription factor [Lepagella sp.]